MVGWNSLHPNYSTLLLLFFVNAEPNFGGGLHAVYKREAINKEMEDYLTRFGYLPQSDLETGALRTMQQLSDAIRNLQGFAGINMTGEIDSQTKKLLKQKRCGVQDVSLGFRNKRSIRVKRYNLQGQRWSHSNLTWSLRRMPRDHYVTRDIIRTGPNLLLKNEKQFTSLFPTFNFLTSFSHVRVSSNYFWLCLKAQSRAILFGFHLSLRALFIHSIASKKCIPVQAGATLRPRCLGSPHSSHLHRDL